MTQPATSRSLKALSAANFFLADVRDGLGPFLGAFLVLQGWSADRIGFALTLGSLAAMLATGPAGAWADRTRAKRMFLCSMAFLVAVGALVVLVSTSFGAVAAAQVVMGAAGAAITPTLASVTLGLVGQAGLTPRLGRNEAWNHGGNAAAAVLGGLLGFYGGLTAVVLLIAGMALASIAATLLIRPGDIDHAAARGCEGAEERTESGWRVLLTSKPLLVFGIVIALFHLGNAAMLPLLSQAATSRQLADPAVYAALTVIIAQITMVPMALYAAKLADTRGYWLVLVVALAALPIRGLIAGYWDSPWSVVPVQILDGVAAGMIGVATPGLAARILAGSGHVNAGYGAVETLHRVGAAFSATLAGLVAARAGYDAAFLTLGGVALAALAIWMLAAPMMRTACNPLRAPRTAGTPAFA